MSNRINQQLAIDALTMAIHHSDQGIQYSKTNYKTSFEKTHGMIASMSRRGNCYDNAVAESFFSNLKNVLVYPCDYTIAMSKSCNIQIHLGCFITVNGFMKRWIMWVQHNMEFCLLLNQLPVKSGAAQGDPLIRSWLAFSYKKTKNGDKVALDFI